MKRLKRWLRGPTAVLVLYAAVALNPSLLFAHELRVENVVLHSREPLPPEARTILQEARARAAKRWCNNVSMHLAILILP